MKTKETIEAEMARVQRSLNEETNPLSYIYGTAQLRALKWVLEEGT